MAIYGEVPQLFKNGENPRDSWCVVPIPERESA